MSHTVIAVEFTPVMSHEEPPLLWVTSNPKLDRVDSAGPRVRLGSDQISLRFTPEQARALAAALLEHADRAEVANG